MSGGGGRRNPIQDLEELAKDPVNTIASAITNTMTLGTVGVENGNFTEGVNIRALDEVTGEVTGRNLARKQAMDTQAANRAAMEQTERDRRLRVQQQEVNERNLSNRARTRTTGIRGSTGTSDVSIEQQMAVDFLGL